MEGTEYKVKGLSPQLQDLFLNKNALCRVPSDFVT